MGMLLRADTENRKLKIRSPTSKIRNFPPAPGSPWRVDFTSSDGNPGTNGATCNVLAAKFPMNTRNGDLQATDGAVCRRCTSCCDDLRASARFDQFANQP